MTFFYIICAVAGGTLVICQFVMTLMGLGGDDFGGDADVGDVDVPDADIGASGHHDAAAHPSSNWLFGVLSLRTLVAGITFFGLAGWAFTDLYYPGTLDWPAILVLSIGVGLGAVFVVATIMRSLTKLNLDGTIRIQRSIGQTGTVYLSIPAAKGGAGKIHVSVQGRMKEYKAITSESELPTGTKVVIVKVATADTVEVRKAESREETAANVVQS